MKSDSVRRGERVSLFQRHRGRAGVLVASAREFVDAVARLADDDAGRRKLAEAAGAHGRSLDWRVLAKRYNEVLDRHIPALGREDR